MSHLDDMLHAEAANASPCAITVRRLKDGTVSARMSFAPGMETASASGASVDDAMTALAACLSDNAPHATPVDPRTDMLVYCEARSTVVGDFWHRLAGSVRKSLAM